MDKTCLGGCAKHALAHGVDNPGGGEGDGIFRPGREQHGQGHTESGGHDGLLPPEFIGEIRGGERADQVDGGHGGEKGAYLSGIPGQEG